MDCDPHCDQPGFTQAAPSAGTAARPRRSIFGAKGFRGNAANAKPRRAITHTCFDRRVLYRTRTRNIIIAPVVEFSSRAIDG